MRKVEVIALRYVVAAVRLSEAVFAQNSTDQKKDKKEQKKENKATEQKVKIDGKAKKNDPAAEVKRIYDSFNNSKEPVKKKAGLLRKSINVAWSNWSNGQAGNTFS